MNTEIKELIYIALLVITFSGVEAYHDVEKMKINERKNQLKRNVIRALIAVSLVLFWTYHIEFDIIDFALKIGFMYSIFWLIFNINFNLLAGNWLLYDNRTSFFDRILRNYPYLKLLIKIGLIVLFSYSLIRNVVR